MLNEYETASAARGLCALMRDPAFSHDVAAFNRYVGEDATARMRQLEAEYVEANGFAATNLLSADARAYWEEVRHTLAYGRMVLAMGAGRAGRKAELTLSRKCEELSASFDNRVPDVEKGMFVVHDINDPLTWDDRWHACIDGDPPLLRLEFTSRTSICADRRAFVMGVRDVNSNRSSGGSPSMS